MEGSLIITDVTRMGGNRVCIAGINPDGDSYRLLFSSGNTTEFWLYYGDQVVINPFAEVVFNFKEHRPIPPHSEDWIVSPATKIKNRQLDEVEKKDLLSEFAVPSVEYSFHATIHHNPGYYVREGEGLFSLGTVKVSVSNFVYNWAYENWDYRMRFSDPAGNEYHLAITDLSLRYFVDHLRDRNGLTCQEISQQLTRKFQTSTVFLRVGLTRPTWKKHPGCCFLQINGVYTFPDYLEGRCFADFKLPTEN